MSEHTFEVPDLAEPIDRDGVMDVIPHRDPFLWLDRIVALEPGAYARGELHLSPDLPLFAGHFPGNPVLPGVIIMEALAQTAGYAIGTDADLSDRLGMFASIDGARFRNQVKPGDTLVLEARIVKLSKRMATAEVTAYVDGAIAAEASQRYVMVNQDDQ